MTSLYWIRALGIQVISLSMSFRVATLVLGQNNYIPFKSHILMKITTESHLESKKITHKSIILLTMWDNGTWIHMAASLISPWLLWWPPVEWLPLLLLLLPNANISGSYTGHHQTKYWHFQHNILNMSLWTVVNIGSSSGLIPDWTKPLPELIVIYCQLDPGQGQTSVKVEPKYEQFCQEIVRRNIVCKMASIMFRLLCVTEDKPGGNSYPMLNNTDSKILGANMGSTWGRQDPGGPHVGPMNLTIWVVLIKFVVSLRCCTITVNTLRLQ